MFGDNEYCMLLVSGSAFAQFGIFGQPIFQKRYVVHDMENFKMSFAPLANLGALPLWSELPPTTLLSTVGPDLATFITAILLYAGCCYAGWRYYFLPNYV